jgi:hypothetical protein
MGWNQGYTIFEATVIGAHDLGKLDKELLAVLMEPYRNSDIDSGGEAGTLTHDGQNIMEVVVRTWGGEVPARPASTDDKDQYWDRLSAEFRKVTDHFGWH